MNGRIADTADQRAVASPALTRRAAVGACVAGAAAVGLGEFGALAGEPDTAFVRPPGASSNRALTAACDRCNRCVQACPYGIVVPAALSDGVVTYGTPVLDFRLGRCDFCMKCTEACPTRSLAFGIPAERDLGVAVVVSDACVAWDWSGCTVCHDECPVEGAITLDEHNRPVVHADYCDGCGTCENKCPSSSLRSYNARVHDRGIVVVSRASQAAAAGGIVTSEELRSGRRKPTGTDPLEPHSKGVHLDGPEGTRTAGGSDENR